jgi:putative DNA primase/helicase
VSLSLAEYAAAKRLPEEFLRELGLRDDEWLGQPALAVPYLDQDGAEIAVRYRLSLNGPDPFRWEQGTKAKGLVYGLEHWKRTAAAGYALLVEGESDCHSAWLHGVPASGIPGTGLLTTS